MSKTRYVLGFAALAILVAIPVIAGVFLTHGTKAAVRVSKFESQDGVTSASEGSEKASVFGQAGGKTRTPRMARPMRSALIRPTRSPSRPH